MKNSFFFYDYETFGTDPKSDRVSQFAGIRTDENFNIIDEPVNIYCKPANDFLPNPYACLITQITPQIAKEKGINENEFFDLVEKELGKNGTCGLGYNTVSFDDEFTRFGFYRNFINPYEREWKNGNSRWDLINVLRMTKAINPDSFYTPLNEKNKPSFKLEDLTKANGIEHENAHDALADVIGTIEMAKIAKASNPEVFQILFEQRQKNNINKIIESKKPFLMAEGYFGSDSNYVELLYPVAKSTKNPSEFYCVKINKDISKLIDMNPDEINEYIFSKDSDDRAPLHSIKINKCPVILTLDNVSSTRMKELGFDGKKCRENLKIIKSNENIAKNIQQGFEAKGFDEYTDPDMMLYSRFFNRNDEYEIKRIRSTSDSEKQAITLPKNIDNRIPELLFRYIGRNSPESFNSENLHKWNTYCFNRITDDSFNASITKKEYIETIKEIREDNSLVYKNKEETLNQLEIYLFELEELISSQNKRRKKPSPR